MPSPDLSDAAPTVEAATKRVKVAVGSRGSTALVEGVRRLDAAGVVTEDLALHRPSLDDVFLAVTGHVTETTPETESKSRKNSSRGSAVMTAIAESLTTRVRPSAVQMARWAISDSLVMTRRNLLVWLRVPAYIVFTVVQPIIFVLLFRYVFGGAIHTASAGGYVSYLMPGIIAQTAAFATFATAIALAQEATKGVIDRFRAMPMARSAVLAGRLIANSIRMLIVILVIVGVGYAVGFRFQNGVVGAIGMVLLAEAFGIAVCAVSAFVGTGDQGRGIGAGLRTDLDLPADLRQLCLRPGLDDAHLAAGLREQPAGDPGHQRHALDGARRAEFSAEPGTLGEPRCGWRARCSCSSRWRCAATGASARDSDPPPFGVPTPVGPS